MDQFVLVSNCLICFIPGESWLVYLLGSLSRYEIQVESNSVIDLLQNGFWLEGILNKELLSLKPCSLFEGYLVRILARKLTYLIAIFMVALISQVRWRYSDSN
jgi:hypothetical protein